MYAGSRRKLLEQQIITCEKRLQRLTEDYEVLSEQISFEGNLKAKNDIRRQLAATQNEITEVELEQEKIYAKLRILNDREKPPEPQPHPPVPPIPVPPPSPTPPYPSPPYWLLKYLIAFGTSVLLVVMWTYLGSAVRFELDDLMGDKLLTRATQGFIGGLFTGLLLYLTTFLQSYTLQRPGRFNSARLMGFCAVAALVGSVSWFLPELFFQQVGNEENDGKGASYGTTICIFFSLLALWIPLSLNSYSRD